MQNERELLRTRISIVQSGLTKIRPSDIISKISMESELRNLQRVLEALDHTEPKLYGEMTVAFGRGPVDGSSGIDASFAGEMLQRWPKFISAIESEQSGRSPKHKANGEYIQTGLLLTGIVRGSFGFVLQELPPKLPAGQLDLIQKEPTALAAAIDRCALIMSAMGTPSDGERYIQESSDAVYKETTQLFRSLSRAGASIKGRAFDREFDLEPEQIAWVSERLDTFSRETQLVSTHGCLTGVLPFEREFEFWIEESGATIKGRLGPLLRGEDLRPLLGRPTDGDRHTGQFLIRETTRGRATHHAYVLLSLAEDDSEGVSKPEPEDAPE